MNPVLILTRNALEMTKRSIESIRGQDIPTEIVVYDNASTDGTPDWLTQQKITFHRVPYNHGVSAGWNFWLGSMLTWNPHILVVNNDTVLPPWFYRRLLECEVDFVTGISVGSRAEIAEEPPIRPLVPSPDFSAFLIRRAAWDAIGPFDETMKHYASDVDYHLRAQQLGLELWNSGVPFYHERSSTLRLAHPFDRALIEHQADLDRAHFRQKWPGYAI